jgi:ribonuclease Z
MFKNNYLCKYSLLAVSIVVSVAASVVSAAPCMIVTLTGTQGGPSVYGGLAGTGTLVRYGDDADGCDAVRLQFDAGRGTSMRLSQIPVQPSQLHAIFLTHLHSDHVDGLADILQMRWHFSSKGPRVDIVCSADAPAKAAAGAYTMSCENLVAHIGDAYLKSGEIEQRASEDATRPAGGPAAAANVLTFEPRDEAQVVWSRGPVSVSAVRSAHIAGHASYRVDTPAGSVVIGGDAGNDTPAPPRASSTSAQVEKLAYGADIIVHSAIHPVMGPDRGSGFPAPIYHRQSTATDLGAMAQRAGAKHLMLTHLIPPLGARQQGPYKVPGGALSASDYAKSAQAGGFSGNIVVGTDLISVRLPAK